MDRFISFILRWYTVITVMVPTEELEEVAKRDRPLLEEAQGDDHLRAIAIHRDICEYIARKYPRLAKAFIEGSAFKDQIDNLKVSRSNREVVAWLNHQLELVAPIVKKVARNEAQAKRDMEVFERWCRGLVPAKIPAKCPWLSSSRSANKALARIVMIIREDFQIGVGQPILTNPGHQGSAARGRSRTLKKIAKYNRAYYKAHPELREKARDNMRKKRAEGRDDRTTNSK